MMHMTFITSNIVWVMMAKMGLNQPLNQIKQRNYDVETNLDYFPAKS